MFASHSTKNHSHTRFIIGIITLVLLAFFLIIGCLFKGSSEVSMTAVNEALWHRSNDTISFIVWETRLPALLTALLAGAALGVTGLVMQTVFENPLADPGVLGVNAGAALGVALVTLACGGSVAIKGMVFSGFLLTAGAAIIGAGFILALLTFCSSIVRSYLTLLIIGVMVSYLTSSVISILNFYSTTQGISAFVAWGFGDFSTLTNERLSLLSIGIGGALLLVLLQAKSLNALLMGENYARSIGVSVQRSRTFLLFLAGCLSAFVTATCGPISFIGLAVPHIVRLLFRTANHRILMPLCTLTGGVIGLLCHWASQLSPEGTLPINALTPIVGVPIILYLLIKGKTF